MNSSSPDALVWMNHFGESEDMEEPDGLGLAPVCDLCGLELELIPTDAEGHPIVELSCLIHGTRRTWRPFADS